MDLDGKLLTRDEFIRIYGGDDEWSESCYSFPRDPSASTPARAQGPARPDGKFEYERRFDVDGAAYTQAEFAAYYGENAQGACEAWEGAATSLSQLRSRTSVGARVPARPCLGAGGLRWSQPGDSPLGTAVGFGDESYRAMTAASRRPAAAALVSTARRANGGGGGDSRRSASDDREDAAKGEEGGREAADAQRPPSPVAWRGSSEAAAARGRRPLTPDDGDERAPPRATPTRVSTPPQTLPREAAVAGAPQRPPSPEALAEAAEQLSPFERPPSPEEAGAPSPPDAADYDDNNDSCVGIGDRKHFEGPCDEAAFAIAPPSPEASPRGEIGESAGAAEADDGPPPSPRDDDGGGGGGGGEGGDLRGGGPRHSARLGPLPGVGRGGGGGGRGASQRKGPAAGRGASGGRFGPVEVRWEHVSGSGAGRGRVTGGGVTRLPVGASGASLAPRK